MVFGVQGLPFGSGRVHKVVVFTQVLRGLARVGLGRFSDCAVFAATTR